MKNTSKLSIFFFFTFTVLLCFGSYKDAINPSYFIIGYSNGKHLLCLTNSEYYKGKKVTHFNQVEKKDSVKMNVYPNPAITDFVMINLEIYVNSDIIIYGYQEKKSKSVLYEGKLMRGSNKINLNLKEFNKGVVFIDVRVNNAIYNSKLIKL